MPTDYDNVPYQTRPNRKSHPAHLSLVGRLYGLQPAPTERCRVLELGCGAGGNLLPMAANLPQGRFVGIDLSEVAIREAKAAAAELGLDNLEFFHGSITDIDEGWGVFDYILCHGVFSWVPEEVRQAILRVMKRNLAPGGIGFLSHNAHPGWGLHGTLRQMMLYHTRDIPDPKGKVHEARTLLDFLSESTSVEHWGASLRSARELLKDVPDWYLFHDHLAPANRAFWLSEIAELLGQNGLRYLSNAEFNQSVLSNFPGLVQHVLGQLGEDRVQVEQYLDFLTARMFRQTLLCHAEQPLQAAPDWRVMTRLSFISRAHPVDEEADPRAPGALKFSIPNAGESSTEHPLVKAMLLTLHQRRPAPVSFEELVTEARRLVGDAPSGAAMSQEEEHAFIGQQLLNLFMDEAIRPHSATRPYATVLSERPAVWPYARLQARRTSQSVTNPYHEAIALNDFDRFAVHHLDGTRDAPALVERFLEDIRARRVPMRKADGSPMDEGELRAALSETLQVTLKRCLYSALLAG